MNCVLHYNVRVVLYFSVHVHVTQELIHVLTDMMLYSLQSLVQVFNPNIISHMRQFGKLYDMLNAEDFLISCTRFAQSINLMVKVYLLSAPWIPVKPPKLSKKKPTLKVCPTDCHQR